MTDEASTFNHSQPGEKLKQLPKVTLQLKGLVVLNESTFDQLFSWSCLTQTLHDYSSECRKIGVGLGIQTVTMRRQLIDICVTFRSRKIQFELIKFFVNATGSIYGNAYKRISHFNLNVKNRPF